MTERLQALPSQTSAPTELPWCPTSYSPCLLLRRHRRPCGLPLLRIPYCEPLTSHTNTRLAATHPVQTWARLIRLFLQLGAVTHHFAPGDLQRSVVRLGTKQICDLSLSKER